jgi:hypothetical protein
LNLIEWHDNELKIGLVETKRQIRGRQCPRNRNPLSFHAIVTRGIAIAEALRIHRRSNNDGTVLVAHACAMRKERVLVDEVRVGVKRDCSHLVLALERCAVERFDIRQHLIDHDAAGVDSAAGQAVEHERVVGIGTMGNRNLRGFHLSLPARRIQLVML